jgi:hypothetical protein
MGKKKFLFVIFFMSIFLSKNLFPAIKGSESALSIEPYYTFPAADGDNTMLGFGWFKNGFGLEDATTSCTFDSVFPVSGNIYLNGGTLHLSADLLLRNMTNWCTSGKVCCHDYFVDFSTSVTGLSSTVYSQVFDNAKVNINSDLVISGSLKFSGDCMFNGNGKRILLDEGGYLLIDANSTVTFKDVAIDGIAEGKLICLDDSSKIVFDDIRWIQDGDYSFTQGSFKIFNDVDFIGSHTFFYQSGQTSTIDTHSFWNLFQGIRLSIGRKTGATGAEPLYFEDTTSVMKLENCCFNVTSSGMRLTRGMMIVDRGVEIDINSTDSTHGFIFGDGVEANDMEFRFHPGARVLFSRGHVVYENVDPRSLRSRSGEALLVREADSIFYLNNDVYFEGLALDMHPSSTLYIADGKELKYIGCRIINPSIEYEFTGGRYNDYTNLMDGNCELFLIRGTLSPYTYVEGTGNKLRGNGYASGKIILQDSSVELTIDLNGMLSSNIELNGGKVILGYDIVFTQDAIFSGSGKIVLGNNQLKFGSVNQVWGDSIYWDANGAHFCFGSKIELSSTWTFSGVATIHGNGGSLDLAPGGELVVESNSKLILRDIGIDGIVGNNIRCVDDTATIELNRVNWQQTADCSFAAGKFVFENETYFCGNYTFSYESSQTSTINTNSRWAITEGMKLSIGRKKATNYVEPVYFEDITSILKLSNCDFVVTGSGMALRGGTFCISHDVVMDINSSTSSNGLILGDGTADGNIKINFYPGSGVHLQAGHLVMDVIDPNFMSLQQGNARMIRGAQSIVYINQDVHIKNLIVDSDLLSDMQVASGKTVSYENCPVETVFSDFTLTGVRGTDYVNFLMGNGDIYLRRGTLPLYTYVWGAGNKIRGNGNVGGAVALQNSGAELTFDLNGSVTNSISLGGGKLSLGNDLLLVCDKILVGPGKVDLRAHNLKLGSLDKTWGGSIYWDGTDGHVQMNSNISLMNTWTFSGVCTIEGKRNVLEFLEGGELVVDRGSTLILKETKLKNLSGSRIRCIDDTSTVIFYGSSTMLDGDYSFTVGNINVADEFEVHGTYTFAYKGSQPFVVGLCSTLRMMDNTTFSYDPSISSSSLMMLEGSKSIIELNDATLHVSNVGLQLTCGKLNINDDCFIRSDASTPIQGLFFGDGVDSGKDIEVNINSSSTLKILSGYVTDKNVD